MPDYQRLCWFALPVKPRHEKAAMLKRRVQVEALMPNEVEAALAEALKTEQLMVDPLVTVTVAEYQSRPISVMGAVERAPDANGEELVRRISVKALIDAADPEANLNPDRRRGDPGPGSREDLCRGKCEEARRVSDSGWRPDDSSHAAGPFRGPAPRSQAGFHLSAGRPIGSDERDPDRVERHSGPEIARFGAARERRALHPRPQRPCQHGALEKLLLVGGGAVSAVVYAGDR